MTSRFVQTSADNTRYKCLHDLCVCVCVCKHLLIIPGINTCMTSRFVQTSADNTRYKYTCMACGCVCRHLITPGTNNYTCMICRYMLIACRKHFVCALPPNVRAVQLQPHAACSTGVCLVCIPWTFIQKSVLWYRNCWQGMNMQDKVYSTSVMHANVIILTLTCPII